MACPRCNKAWRKVEYIDGEPYIICECGYREEAKLPVIKLNRSPRKKPQDAK